MAFSPTSTSTLLSSDTSSRPSPSFISFSRLLRRRLPLVGAFCVLTLGLFNLYYTPLCSSALKTGSKFGSRSFSKNSHSIRMEGNTNNTTIVPSIVVYVTVPNKEAVAMFMFYSLVPVLLKMNGSTMLNLSLLTSDIWAVLIRIFAYHEKVDWMYFVAFGAVVVGLVIYSGFSCGCLGLCYIKVLR